MIDQHVRLTGGRLRSLDRLVIVVAQPSAIAKDLCEIVAGGQRFANMKDDGRDSIFLRVLYLSDDVKADASPKRHTPDLSLLNGDMDKVVGIGTLYMSLLPSFPNILSCTMSI